MPELAQRIVMKVGMHCEGCARKVRKTLTHMAGVEELQVDYSDQKVTMKGTLDPKKVLEKLYKAGKIVEILEVTEEPPKPAEEVAAEPAKEDPPPPEIQSISLRVPMHCEGCARKVKYVLRKISGVQEVEVDFKEQKVTVKGTMDTNRVLRKASKTGKYVELWPTPPEEPKEAPKETPGEEKKDAPTEENKDEAKREEKNAPSEEKKEENFVHEEPKKEEAKEEAKEDPKEENKDVPKEGDSATEEKKDKPELKPEENDASKQNLDEEKHDEFKDGFKSFEEQVTNAYVVYRCDAPQIFSDDNPNACSIM